MIDESLVYIGAFFYGVLIAGYFIHQIVELTWEIIRIDTGVYEYLKRYSWLVSINGMIERTLYICALLAGSPNFIAFWIGVKTIAGSERWGLRTRTKNEISEEIKRIPGRAIYSTFLVGNGLSLLYAFVGFSLIKCIERKEYWFAFFVGLSLICGSLLIIGCLRDVLIKTRIEKEGRNLTKIAK
jgi:hypothetical protein